MKRVASLVILTLALSACGGSGSSSGVACTQQFWNGVLGVCLPEAWTVLEREKLAERGVPPQVIVAFQSQKAVSGQTPTLTVTSERLTTPLESPAYSSASIRSVTTLPGYKLLDSRTMDIEGKAVDLHVFTAQPIAGEPERRFYQLSAVAAGIGYTFTALTPVSIGDTLEKELLVIFNSVRFTEPGPSST
jgi:hypothetical protein